MNSRIYELMIEAGYAAPEIATRGEKLAKLIIDECIDICYNVDGGDGDYSANTAANIIGIRFGAD